MYQKNIKLDQYPEIWAFVEQEFGQYRQKLKNHLVLLIVNVLLEGTVAVPRGMESYRGKNWSEYVTYHLIRKAEDLLVKEGYITIKGGMKARPGFKRGICSRITITDKLKQAVSIDLSRPPEVDVKQLHDLIVENKDGPQLLKHKEGQSNYKVIVNIHNIIIKDDKDNTITTYNTNNNIKDIPIPIHFYNNALRNTYILNNQYFNKIRVTQRNLRDGHILSNVYLTRIFDSEGCGRHYQLGGRSYLQLRRGVRKEELLINGVTTEEVDFSAMHISLMYNLIGLECPSDAYTPVVKGLIGTPDAELRGAVKTCILSAINATTERKYVLAINKKNFDQYMKRLKGKFDETPILEILRKHDLGPRDVLRVFKKKHPLIAPFLNTGMGKLLMFHDSNIMENILLHLMDKNIYGLPLFDSIICQEGYEDRVKAIMEEEYSKYTGFRNTAEIKPRFESQKETLSEKSILAIASA